MLMALGGLLAITGRACTDVGNWLET